MPTNLIKTMVYMPPDLRETLQQMATQENRSLSNLIVTLLQKAVEEQKREEETRKEPDRD